MMNTRNLPRSTEESIGAENKVKSPIETAIREMLKQRGSKIEWLAGQLGVTVQTLPNLYKKNISDWKNGYVEKLRELGLDIDAIKKQQEEFLKTKSHDT